MNNIILPYLLKVYLAVGEELDLYLTGDNLRAKGKGQTDAKKRNLCC